MRKLRILVADDNVDSVETLALLLRLHGHDVQHASSGSEAIRLASQCRPDVALLDLKMPDLDGYEAAIRLRQIPESGPLTLIALTGWVHAEVQAQAVRAGFDHCLTKPVGWERLDALLRDAALALEVQA